MRTNLPPKIEIPFELYPFILQEIRPEHFRVLVMPTKEGLRWQDPLGHFVWKSKEDLALRLGDMTGQSCWVVSLDSPPFYVTRHPDESIPEYPQRGWVDSIEHNEPMTPFMKELFRKTKRYLAHIQTLDPELSLTRRDAGEGVQIFDYSAVIKNSVLESGRANGWKGIERFCRLFRRPVETDGELVMIQARNKDDMQFLGCWLDYLGLQSKEAPVDYYLAYRERMRGVMSVGFLGGFAGTAYEQNVIRTCIDDEIWVYFKPGREIWLRKKETDELPERSKKK